MICDYLQYSWQLVNGFRSTHEEEIAQMREQDLSLSHCDKASVLILDLANGQLRPQYRILRAKGYRVCGIDMVNSPPSGWRDHAYRVARLLYRMRIVAPSSLRDDTLVKGDVSVLPFRDRSIDLVTSVAAFEHFVDVPAVISELHRILKPGGQLWVLIHLFSCPSGGHNVSLSQVPLSTIPSGIEPWDHLRKRRLPFHVPLNEWRRDEYLEEFKKHFEVLKHYCAMREGEHFLTPQIEQELSTYTVDELTCGAYVIVARKVF